MLLDGGRRRVTCETDILQEYRVQRRAGEDKDGLGDTSASGLDGYIVILFKVDASVLLGRILGIAKEFLL